MLNECYNYQEAINAKGKPFPSEALLMSLVFVQHKMIDHLIKKIKELEVELLQGRKLVSCSE